METLFLYFGKAMLVSGVMFLYYRIFLKDKNFHHYNRFYLLATVAISLLLPLLKTDYFTVEVKGAPYLFLANLRTIPSPKPTAHGFPVALVFALALGAVSVILLTRFLCGIVQIFKLKRKYPHHQRDGICLYFTDLADAPFAFFRNLFWKQDILPDSEAGRQILKHEMVHIEQRHSYDQVFIQTVSSIFWFNPIFYLIKKEISLIHEYLADKKSLKNSDSRAFAQMLLAAHFSGKVVPGTSPLISSNLKKRLKMLQNPKTKFSYARRVFALPMLFTIVFVFIIKAKNKEIEKVNSAVPEITFNKRNFMAADAVKNDRSVADTTVPKKAEPAKNLNNYPSVADDGALHTAREAMKAAEETSEKDAKSAMEEARKAADDAQKTTAHEMAKVAEHLDKIKEEAAKSQEFLNSREYADAMDEARKNTEFVKSPEFKKMLKDAKRAEKEGKNAAEKAHAYTTSPEFKKMMEDARKAAEAGRKAGEEAAAFTQSAEFKKMIEEAKAVAENSKKYAQNAVISGNSEGRGKFIFDGVTIDGRPSTMEELDRLGDNIKQTVIHTENKDGKKYKSIDVTTK